MPANLLSASRRSFLLGSAGIPLLWACGRAGPILSAPSTPAANSLNLTAPDGRTVLVTQWEPQGEAVGHLVFSHGAALAPNQYLRVIEPLVAAGWHVYAPLHTDSEQHPDTGEYTGFETWRTRIEDMRAISAHIGDRPYVAAGHSYGGLTALVMGGSGSMVPEGITGSIADPKVSCVLALSPPAPIPGFVTRADYASLAVPALIQTGTEDVPAGMENGDWQGHLAPYDEAAEGGDRYALILEDVDHYYGGAIGRLQETSEQMDRQLAVSIEIAQEFLVSCALGSADAQDALTARLTSELPVRLLRK